MRVCLWEKNGHFFLTVGETFSPNLSMIVFFDLRLGVCTDGARIMVAVFLIFKCSRSIVIVIRVICSAKPKYFIQIASIYQRQRKKMMTIGFLILTPPPQDFIRASSTWVEVRMWSTESFRKKFFRHQNPGDQNLGGG